MQTQRVDVQIHYGSKPGDLRHVLAELLEVPPDWLWCEVRPRRERLVAFPTLWPKPTAAVLADLHDDVALAEARLFCGPVVVHLRQDSDKVAFAIFTTADKPDAGHERFIQQLNSLGELSGEQTESLAVGAAESVLIQQDLTRFGLDGLHQHGVFREQGSLQIIPYRDRGQVVFFQLQAAPA